MGARALRQTHLAREQPHLPATDEFTQDENDTVLLLRDRRTKVTGKRLGDVPTMGELVRWIADLGGCTGKSSGGPAGATVVGRGLERITFAAEVPALSRSREKWRMRSLLLPVASRRTLRVLGASKVVVTANYDIGRAELDFMRSCAAPS